jgi:hypothetical protein
MRDLLGLIGALTSVVLLSVGCAANSDCAAANRFAPVTTAVYDRSGLVIGAYVTPTGGGVTIGNDCDRVLLSPKSETSLCAYATQDDACTTCLKADCCSASAAWLDGVSGAGAELGACVNAHCNAACPRAK